MYIPSIESQSF